jgi:hypothetical protein
MCVIELPFEVVEDLEHTGNLGSDVDRQFLGRPVNRNPPDGNRPSLGST